MDKKEEKQTMISFIVIFLYWTAREDCFTVDSTADIIIIRFRIQNGHNFSLLFRPSLLPYKQILFALFFLFAIRRAVFPLQLCGMERLTDLPCVI